MIRQKSVEPDIEALSEKFQKEAAEKGMCLDRLPGGFYVDQATQHAWADCVCRAMQQEVAQ